jgi:sugar/nucleoside kinase (ribokinase family)
MAFDVFGMCNALHDIQAAVGEDFLVELGLVKGSMTLIDEHRQRQIMARIPERVVNSEPGGSGANTMIGIAQLGGSCCFTSRVGRDSIGRSYADGLRRKGVQPNLATGEGDTGTCLVLITPDAQRTMLTYLGEAVNLQASDVRLADLRASKYVYITGYLWDRPNQREAVAFAMHAANRAGVPVCLSLSDSFCVARHKDDLRRLLRDHVDVVVCNADEAQGLMDADTPEQAARALSEVAHIAVVTMDSRGSLIASQHQCYRISAYAVNAVDTTGAGDMYAAGLLYGLAHGLPLEIAGSIGANAAAQVVGQLGPRVEELDLREVNRLRKAAQAP